MNRAIASGRNQPAFRFVSTGPNLDPLNGQVIDPIKIPLPFAQEYETHAVYIRHFVAHLLNGSGVRDLEADDICHDVFIKFSRYLESGTIVTNVPALLLTIAKHETLNAIAHAHNRTSVGAGKADDNDANGDASPETVETHIDRVALLEEVKRLLNRHSRTPERDYEIFTRYFVHGQRYCDIAKAMRVTNNVIQRVVVDLPRRAEFRNGLRPLLSRP